MANWYTLIRARENATIYVLLNNLCVLVRHSWHTLKPADISGLVGMNVTWFHLVQVGLAELNYTPVGPPPLLQRQQWRHRYPSTLTLIGSSRIARHKPFRRSIPVQTWSAPRSVGTEPWRLLAVCRISGSSCNAGQISCFDQSIFLLPWKRGNERSHRGTGCPGARNAPGRHATFTATRRGVVIGRSCPKT